MKEILQKPYLISELSSRVARQAVRDAFQASLLLTFRALVGFAVAVLIVSIFCMGGPSDLRKEEEETDGDHRSRVDA